ncbi:UPF0149 family protein [Aestuariibacter sp. AA17]|uniref:UPF0149 family protein n=1 Tax=Fluctibacter corallii TaxID=2984329 RepID=A0ABT3A503_9ALTE|nr:UPF0149 family protein [Aestuariibacter sp. AA17]MCV2883456.1 UPF0149 family protein [Aestuariibacter sp. AA17]
MSNESQNAYEKSAIILEQHKILTSASEIHGMMVGMLSGGMSLDNRDWLEPLADFINEGEALSDEVKQHLLAVFNDTCQQLVETEFSLTLCLPDDAAPINERGHALIDWVHGFMLGFGLFQADLTKCSDDVKEALQDFSEIAKMDEEMTPDEESERALFEVVEYVRVSSMLCFNELGKPAEEDKETPTVH